MSSDKIIFDQTEMDPLEDAAENVVIAYYMGWDLDGVMLRLKEALGIEITQ